MRLAFNLSTVVLSFSIVAAGNQAARPDAVERALFDGAPDRPIFDEQKTEPETEMVLDETSPVIYGGRRTDSLELTFKESVVSLKKMQEGKSGQCSGTIVQGCVVTSAHCLGDAVQIYSGTSMDEASEHKLLGRMGSWRILGSGKGKEDLAIIRASKALPKALWQPTTIFAETEFDGVPNTSTVWAIGWGISQTTERKVDGRWQRVDEGAGTKRYGQLTYRGRSNGLLAFNRANSSQHLAGGDSGGPVFERDGQKVVLIGVTQSGLLRPLEEKDDKESRRSVDNVVSFAVDVSMNRAWLEENLKELKCGDDSVPSALQTFVYERLGKDGREALKAWEDDKLFGAGTKNLAELKKLVLDEAKLSGTLHPYKVISVRVVVGDDGGIELVWTGKFSEDKAEDAKIFHEKFLKDEVALRATGTIKFPSVRD